jgi:hypothetical protein
MINIVNDIADYDPIWPLDDSSHVSNITISDIDDDLGASQKHRGRNKLPRPHTPLEGVKKLATVDEGSTGDVSTIDDDGDMVVTKGSQSSEEKENKNQNIPLPEKINTGSIVVPNESQLATVINNNNEPSESTSNKRTTCSESDSRKDRFIASVGLAEESKLEMFLSENEIEQMTVYCKEFARR